MFKIIEEVLDCLFPKRGHGISILVPFHCPDHGNQRAKNWHWLKRYWKAQLPGAEIVMGEDWLSLTDPFIPFSKSSAVNDAASRATGDIFAIIDADGYLESAAVLHAARKIRHAREHGRRLWFVPYRHFFRLNKEASARLLASNPYDPYEFPHPPPPCDIQNMSGSQHGHWFGAGAQIMPREAFECVGGWDERFRGWGGEDHAAMRAMDTLWWWHKTLPGQFLHVWHPMRSPKKEDVWVEWTERVWANQVEAGANDALSSKYYGAYGHYDRMRRLVEEGQRVRRTK